MKQVQTSSAQIESILVENRRIEPSDEFSRMANISDISAYQRMCDHATTDPVSFWGQLARQNLHWMHLFDDVLDKSTPPFFQWFKDGLLNASFNCLDKHIGTPTENKVAIIFESDSGDIQKITFKELLEKVCQFSHALTNLGIEQGDRVLIYMPMSIEGIVAMQACARIGAIHSVVFGGFSAKSLHERIVDVQPRAVVTANFQYRAGKELPLKGIVDEAVAMSHSESVSKILVYRRSPSECAMSLGRDVFFEDALANTATFFPATPLPSEHPLFILYTSGSTGKPKGIQHSTAGYLLWANLTMQWVFDTQPNDVFWCTADIGWITGHTYVAYGPLLTGTTQVVYESTPSHPHSGRFWEMIERHQCTIFYTAPTVIRSLIKASNTDPNVHPQRYNLTSLRLLGSVGEPINPETWMWYHQNVGRSQCPVLDTFWQTETGGHMIAPLPGATTLVPGSCTLPLPGIEVDITDELGQPVALGQGGLLVIKQPWPSMIRNIWGDPERFKKTYFPVELNGYYLAGDGAVRDTQTGYYRITGRIDDVLNVSGHRLGTMEIESALVSKNELVAEAAVVARPDDITGEAICAFVVLKNNPSDDLEAQNIANILRRWVSSEIGPIAKPKDIRFGDNLPKTRSGKIMRRLLRSIAKNEEISQDISTLENPAILNQFKSIY